MLKAGFIGAIIGFIYVASLNLLSPFCTLCVTPLLGLGVGYLAGWFDNPPTLEVSFRNGSIAGGITGSAVICGQMTATLANAILLTNLKEWPTLMTQMGLPAIPINDYWQATLVTNSFCSIFNMLTIVGLGAVGGVSWFQSSKGKKQDFSDTKS